MHGFLNVYTVSILIPRSFPACPSRGWSWTVHCPRNPSRAFQSSCWGWNFVWQLPWERRRLNVKTVRWPEVCNPNSCEVWPGGQTVGQNFSHQNHHLGKDSTQPKLQDVSSKAATATLNPNAALKLHRKVDIFGFPLEHSLFEPEPKGYANSLTSDSIAQSSWACEEHVFTTQHCCKSVSVDTGKSPEGTFLFACGERKVCSDWRKPVHSDVENFTRCEAILQSTSHLGPHTAMLIQTSNRGHYITNPSNTL